MTAAPASAPLPPLADHIRIEAVYTRSINLARDADALDLIAAYRPTSRALQCLRQIAAGFSAEPAQRALAAIGPYGVGKSAFALFLGALLSDPQTTAHHTATGVLATADAQLAKQISTTLADGRGYLRIGINGLPDSLQRQLLRALALGAKQAGLDASLVEHILRAAETAPPMDEVLRLLTQVQRAWAHAGGVGVLIEIDELGKFLEYAASHPEQRDLHLLQLLAEHSRSPNPLPIHVLVLLHQSFEQYGARLGRQLRDEWQKVQGRFETIAFLEPAEQALRLLATAMVRTVELPERTQASLERTTAVLASASALPHGLEAAAAQALFAQCYPLHPISLLILPMLCQKVAQNERTLFSYLGSREPFGLQECLRRLHLGDWIWPWEIYDYFILNQSAGLGAPATEHRWAEVVTALERLDVAPDDPDAKALIALLKTIGLLNLIGAQRGLKASQALLRPLFGSKLEPLLARLEASSVIHFRRFSQDYRVWAGSDFDLRAALDEAVTALIGRSLADTLNDLAPLRPLVARRTTIASGNLRTFTPRFTAAERWPPPATDPKELPLWFYLSDEREPLPPELSALASAAEGLAATAVTGILALCSFTERLREVIDEWMALSALPKHHAALHQDPVAAREHSAWLSHAEQQAQQAMRALIAKPEQQRWFHDGREPLIRHRRDLQGMLSDWVEQHFPQAPRLNNELINRDAPSSSANLGRKRLIAAMLNAADQPALGIEKNPAEKSIYLNLLAETRLHRQEQGRLGIYPPDAQDDPCRLHPLWQAIHDTLGHGGERQVPLTELYEQLSRPPFGVKLGVLPVLILAYVMAHQREVALYQEGIFCDTLSLEQAELLCRRPALFALERFDLSGLRGELFNRYLHSIVGRLPADASLLDITRPLFRFINALPDYSQHSRSLSATAIAVRRAIQQASSPGALLFEALPSACATAPDALKNADSAGIETFVNHLVAALKELKQAYPALLADWQQQLGQALLDEPPAELAALRQALAVRYQGLDAFTPDRMGLGAFIRRLCDPGHDNDQTWLESVATLIAKVPPAKWRDETQREARLRLHERAGQVRDLERLRHGAPEHGSSGSALLLKRVDAEHGEISQLLHLSDEQRQRAKRRAERILAEQLGAINPTEQLAVFAAMFEQLAPAAAVPEPSEEQDCHD